MSKIMLVEDDNNLREIYQARLTAEGYETVTAADGEEALAMAVKEKPDLIIADIMMPKISGFDMLDILRSTPEVKDTKIIMMTALSQAEDRARAGRLGADRYLVKSQVTLEDVVKTAKEVLENKGDNVPFDLPTRGKPATPLSATTPSPATPATPASTAPTPTDIPVATAPATPPATPAEPATSTPPVEPPVTPPATPSNGATPSTPPSSPAMASAAPAASTAIAIDDSGNLSQPSGEEQASVEAQIKDFIKQTEEPKAEPSPPVAASEPVPIPAEPTPSSPPPTTSIPVTVTEPPKPTAPPPPPPPTPAPQSEMPRHSTKVIPPLHDISKAPDFGDLLAKEDSSPSVPPPTADTVISPDGTTTVASSEPVPIEQAPGVQATEAAEPAPPPPPPSPTIPGHVITPQTPPSDSNTPPADPNSVAL